MTGLGEAVTGAVLPGAAASLPGIVTSVVAVRRGFANVGFESPIVMVLYVLGMVAVVALP